MSMTPVTETRTGSKILQIPLSVPEFRGNEWIYLKECIDSGWVSTAGLFVERFEQEFARYVGAEHAIAVVNGTAALHVALQIVGVRAGDEVLVSDLTFVAPVNAIAYVQAHPVFMDASPSTWQMDVGKLERFLETRCEVRAGECFNKGTGRRVAAVLPVHILGLACEMDRVMGLARRFRLKVVEDAAEAIGVRYLGKQVGTFGDVGAFSFNGNKVVTSGGGGMLVMHEAPLAQRSRYLTTQAKDDDLEYVHKEVGYNYRLTNLQAALGLAQMEQVDQFLQKKRAVAQTYRAALSGLEGIVQMPLNPGTEPSFWLYTILLKETATLADRQGVIQDLRRQGIGARGLWHPIHGLPPYTQAEAFEIEHAISLYTRGISLPSSVGLTPEEQSECIQCLLAILRKNP